MIDNKPPIDSPTLVLNPDDPGDQILERFRFQITYSAILAILMSNDGSQIDEIYCELHEDILVKHCDGKFTGIQVKTKDVNLPPFNIEDDAIIKACSKFAKLHSQFPGHFKAYSIVSNTGFDKSKPAICLQNLIEEVKAGTIEKKKRSKFWSFIKQLAANAACPTAAVLQMIAKLNLHTYCKLEDINFKLINALKLCPLLKGIQESKIEEIADLLIGRHFKASSLINKDGCTEHFVMGISTDQEEINQIVKGKQFIRKQVIEWFTLQKHIPVVLLLKDRRKIEHIPKGHSRLEVKMDAGGIDADNIELMRNFKFAFEQHAISWIHKDGPEKAEERYNQISYITHNACKEIYDQKQITQTLDGSDMLMEIRSVLKSRKLNEPTLFFDCTYEHLLGAVGVLTENCKIWWSEPFDLEEK